MYSNRPSWLLAPYVKGCAASVYDKIVWNIKYLSNLN